MPAATNDTLRKALRTFRFAPSIAELEEFLRDHMPVNRSAPVGEGVHPGVIANAYASWWKDGTGRPQWLNAVCGRYDDKLHRWLLDEGMRQLNAGYLTARLVPGDNGRLGLDVQGKAFAEPSDAELDEWKTLGEARNASWNGKGSIAVSLDGA
jgi:hypothetical protein